jgi:hypothetical protein
MHHLPYANADTSRNSKLHGTPYTRLGILAITAAVFGTSLTLCVKAAKPASRTVRADQVDSELHQLWRGTRKNGRDWRMKQTTWLPSEWPPSPGIVWTRYAYGLDVTLDGSAGVSAPFARVERMAGNDASCVISPMEQNVKSFATHPVRPHGGWNYTLAEETEILSQVLKLESVPSDTRKIAKYYQSWRLGSAEIAAHVASRHRAFFDWLKSQP